MASGSEPQNKCTHASPLHDFFKRFEPDGFVYDPQQPATSEFKRLCDLKDWKASDPDSKSAHARFRAALTEQFNANYGTDEESLDSWQLLCAMVGVEPMPSTLEEARRAFQRTHVNLVDLTEGYTNGKDVQIFDTVKDLSRYTKKNGLIFPKDKAKAGGLLRCLLRRIGNPGLDRRSGESEGRKKRRRSDTGR